MTPINWESHDEAVQWFKDHVDDIDELQIPLPDELFNAAGERFTGGFVLVRTVGGTKLIDTTTAERLVNDGILQRLRIPCSLNVIPKHR